MTSNNESIKIESYSNPHSDRFLQEMFPEPIDFFNYTVDERKARQARDGYAPDFIAESGDIWDNSGEWLQRIYPDFILKVPELDKWYRDTTTWMPQDAQKWWFEQFNNPNNKHLDPMPIEWWRLRTRNLFVARDEDNSNRPVGSLALTMVYLSERDIVSCMPENTKPICYEIRAEVVDESYRGRRLGQMLTRAALLQATLQQPTDGNYFIPTVAVTTNKVMANICKKLKATDRPSESDDFTLGHVGQKSDRYNNMLCWSRYITDGGRRRQVCSSEAAPLPCDACPKRHNTAWWWPTHKPQRMDELGVFEDD